MKKLTKREIIEKYEILKNEVNKRKLKYTSSMLLDRVLFKRAMLGINVSNLGDVVVVPDYISIGGGFVKSPKDAKDVDLIIRQDEDSRDESMELKLSRLTRKQTDKDCHFVYSETGPHSDFIPMFDLVLRAKDETKRVKVKEDYGKIDEIEKGIRPAFGSPGGKRFLAKTIISYIPEHKTYVEPFVGGGAVFFAKEPSKVEVINDLDSEIAFAYGFLKKITEKDIADLKRRKITFSRDLFFRLKNLKPSGDLERFYKKFIYLRSFSFGGTGSSTVRTAEGASVTTLEHKLNRYGKIKERLRETKIENKDFRKILKAYDSEDTFFYLDPPYPEQQGNLKTTLQVRDFELAIEKLKGNWILSMPKKPQAFKLAKKYNYKIVGVERTLNQSTGERHIDKELLISNFPLKKLNIYLAKAEEPLPALEDYENLLHHIHIDDDGKEEIHHCLILDHIANMFEQAHLWIKDGKVYLNEKEIKEGVFHVIKGLEPTQEVVWSDKQAGENKITAKRMKRGMKLKEKSKEW